MKTAEEWPEETTGSKALAEVRAKLSKPSAEQRASDLYHDLTLRPAYAANTTEAAIWRERKKSARAELIAIIRERDDYKDLYHGEQRAVAATEAEAEKNRQAGMLISQCLDAVSNERDSYREKAERYEFVRRLNPAQFDALFNRNIAGEGSFDELVDAARKEGK